MFGSRNVYKYLLVVRCMKKLGVLFLFLLLLMASFVSAQSILQPIADSAKSFYDVILEPFGQFFFGKLLMFIVVLSIVWLVVDRFPLMTGKRKTGLLVAVVVSALSVRWINRAWLDTVILPYSVLGIAMTSLLPFIIYFFFVKDLATRSMRKVAWIFAAVVFAGLFIYRNTVADPSSAFGFMTTGWNPSYIYLFVAVLSFFMLGFDGPIQRALDKMRYQDIADMSKIERRAELVEQYDKLQDRFLNRRITKVEANKLINSLKQRATAFGVDPALFTSIP